MFIFILTDEFLEYTQNITIKLKLQTNKFEYKNKQYDIPLYVDVHIVFVPTEILVKLPISLDKDDIITVCSHNERLRDRVNENISSAFNGTELNKHSLKNLLIRDMSLK